MRRSRGSFLLFFCLVAPACGDDASSADGDGSSSSTSTGADSTTSTGDDTMGDATASTSTTLGSSGTTVADTTDAESSSGSSASSSGSSSDSGSSSSTGGSSLVCEDGGQPVLTWGLQVPGGVYPDDIPADLDATCVFTPSGMPAQLPVSCDAVDLVVTIESDPPVVLPADGQSVDVRVHRQVGPLGFPDFWLELVFESGRRFSFVASSVLVPSNDTVELPYGMALSDEDCGPFNIGTPFEPEDPCGDQMWLGLDLELDSVLTVFHGSYDAGTAEGNDVGVWVGSARDYGVLPKFCDFAASFFTAMVVTEPA